MPRTKKQAIQKVQEKQLRPASAQSAEIVRLNQRLTVIQLLDLGVSDEAISEQLAISVKHLQHIKDEILATLTPNYISAIDQFRARTYGRYERLYRIAEAMATGTVLPGGPFIGQIENMPQKDWVKLALSILSAEADLFKADLEANKRKSDEADEDTLNFTEIRSVTFSRTNPLSQIAAEKIKETWGQDDLIDYIYEDEAALPPIPLPDSEQDKLDNLDPSDLHAQLTALQNRISKVTKGGPLDDPDID